MAKAEYIITDKIKESLKQSRNPAKYFFTDILKNCPDEKNYLFPGKLYVMRYIPEDQPKKLYDTMPYIMSLGPGKKDPEKFYGINMHRIPYKIRVQIFSFLYNIFYKFIDDEILNNSNPEDATNQMYINAISTNLITHSPFNVNIKTSIHAYRLEYISECKLINYNLIHYMLQSEDDYFKNGSITDAQTLFVENMKKS